jgi:hypothetical protein
VVGGNDWWLEQRWRLADALRERAIQEKPLNWAAYEHQLLRAEILRTAGSAFHDEQIEVDTAVERMERNLSLPIVTATKLLPAMQLSATLRAKFPDPVDLLATPSAVPPFQHHHGGNAYGS